MIFIYLFSTSVANTELKLDAAFSSSSTLPRNMSRGLRGRQSDISSSSAAETTANHFDTSDATTKRRSGLAGTGTRSYCKQTESSLAKVNSTKEAADGWSVRTTAMRKVGRWMNQPDSALLFYQRTFNQRILKLSEIFRDFPVRKSCVRSGRIFLGETSDGVSAYGHELRRLSSSFITK